MNLKTIKNKKAANGQEGGFGIAQLSGLVLAELLKNNKKWFALHKLKWGHRYLKQGRYRLGLSLLYRGVIDLMRSEKP
jgi:hypothetical protein